MTDLEKKILSNTKPRIAEYEALFAEQKFEAGKIEIPIMSFDGIPDRLVYDTRKKQVVAVIYPFQAGPGAPVKIVSTIGVNWDEMPDPESVQANPWDLE